MEDPTVSALSIHRAHSLHDLPRYEDRSGSHILGKSTRIPEIFNVLLTLLLCATPVHFLRELTPHFGDLFVSRAETADVVQGMEVIEAREREKYNARKVEETGQWRSSGEDIEAREWR
jgi:hypothetical protein